MGWLRSSSLEELPTTLVDQLMVGGTLFKIGCVVLGLLLIGVGRLNIWEEESHVGQQDTPEKDPSYTWIVIGLLCCAIALRLYELGAGLWYDEIVTYVKYVKMPMGDLLTTYDSENQHFLFSAMAHLCFLLFGDHVWAIRLPAVIFGVGSIWAVYELGRQVGSEKEGLLAAALLTFSYHHIWFSQNARGYSGLLFWTLLSSWIFLRALPGYKAQRWMLYAAAVALGMYTHATMLFVVIGHFVVFVVHVFRQPIDVWSKNWVGCILGFVLSGLLTFQLYALVIPQLLDIMGMTTSVPDWNSPLWTLLEIVKGLKLGFFMGIVALFGGGTILAMGLWSFYKKTPAFVGIMLIPGILGPALVLSSGHPLWPRFFFFLAGFGVLTLIRGLMIFGSRLGEALPMNHQRVQLVGMVLCVLTISVSAISVAWAYGPKQDFGGALNFIEKNLEPTDAVVSVGLATFTYKKFYGKKLEEASTIQELNVIRSKNKRTWVVYTMPLHLKSYFPEILSSLESEFEQVEIFPGTLGGGAVFVSRFPSAFSTESTDSEKIIP
jgi:4-amino-4-deoxy-L-arabinose transferase-like glycosyltransferase